MWKCIKKWIPLFLGLSVIFAVSYPEMLMERAKASHLKENAFEEAAFREQRISPKLLKEIQRNAESRSLSFWNVLTVTMLYGDYQPNRVSTDTEPYLRYKEKEFYRLRNLYRAIWGDVRCFPIAAESISYENTFGAPRTYGGERSHEGCDLFGKHDVSGYYPVLSMTDGVVEKTGWLPLGGYRLGIRASGGAYFYYAHLSGYEKNFQSGDFVSAGDILGYMGNTGYGEEGTQGQFPVHLHLGIYIRVPGNAELSVNPYWVLRTAEKNMRKYTY